MIAIIFIIGFALFLGALFNRIGIGALFLVLAILSAPSVYSMAKWQLAHPGCDFMSCKML